MVFRASLRLLALTLVGAAVSLAGLTAPARAQQSLTAAEVGQVIAQAVNEATARGVAATIAVTDRVGNVLGVFRMNGAAQLVTITSQRTPAVTTGLEGTQVPDTAAAIAKAITGAYLSSNGNAFTTRTASQIVQEHFQPGEEFQPSGPLFGVQFSQLPCSDLSVRFFDNGAGGTVNATLGPKRSPLGLSADPGGLPLYKSGVLVGGVGAISDATYSLDPIVTDIDTSNDELIAVAGTVGFDAPVDIRANRITVLGKSLRYTDRDSTALRSIPANAPAFAAVNGVMGNLIGVTGYYNAAGGVIAGQAFGSAASGYRDEAGAVYGTFRGGRTAFILVDGTNANRFPPRAGTDGRLTAAEVTLIMRAALNVAFNGRAQIRRPFGEHIHVTVSIVDTNGAILAIARTTDGPIFGTDVSLQKARTAALFSNTIAAADLTAGGHATRVQAVRDFLNDQTALANGIAFADRSGGNLSRPFFPDGVDVPNGPLSNPFPQWSPFSTGLQVELIVNNLVQHLQFVTGAAANDTPARCTALPLQMATGSNRLANGLQIFPGSVPLYRNGTLVGGIGISGDGVDQDDMVAFLGAHEGGVAAATGVGNAPAGIRADTLTPRGIRLRYVNCPFAPFLGSSVQNVCEGK